MELGTKLYSRDPSECFGCQHWRPLQHWSRFYSAWGPPFWLFWRNKACGLESCPSGRGPIFYYRSSSQSVSRRLRRTMCTEKWEFRWRSGFWSGEAFLLTPNEAKPRISISRGTKMWQFALGGKPTDSLRHLKFPARNKWTKNSQ